MDLKGKNSFYTEGDRILASYVRRCEDADESRVCRGKYRHQNWRSAALEAKRLSDKGGGKHICYPCPFCTKWHSAHDTKPVAVEAKRMPEPTTDEAIIALTKTVLPKPAPVVAPPPIVAAAKGRKSDKKRIRQKISAATFLRYQATKMLVEQGHTVSEAMRRTGVNQSLYYDIKLSLENGAAVEGGVPDKQPQVAPKKRTRRTNLTDAQRAETKREADRRAYERKKQQPVVVFYYTLRKRIDKLVKRDPSLVIPMPRLRNGKLVLNAATLPYLKPEERAGLFGGAS